MPPRRMFLLFCQGKIPPRSMAANQLGQHGAIDSLGDLGSVDALKESEQQVDVVVGGMRVVTFVSPQLGVLAAEESAKQFVTAVGDKKCQ